MMGRQAFAASFNIFYRIGFGMMGLSTPQLYIQIAPQTLTGRVIGQSTTLYEAADIAIAHHDQGMRVVRAAGNAASLMRGSANVQMHSPFAHPRVVVHEPEIAQALLQWFTKQALGGGWLIKRRPDMVLHPVRMLEGGLTVLEVQSLKAIARAAGARNVHIWTGRTLQDHEVGLAPQPLPQGRWH